jgi:glycogen synthase
MMERLFEISWEVCNKVGGIYTFISSKANYLKGRFEEFYFIGPYLNNGQGSDFEERDVPIQFKEPFEILESKKIFCHYGIWKKTKAKTILIDFSEFMQEKNEIKRKLWEDYKIDSLNSNFWFEEPVVWAYAVGMFLESVYDENRKTVAHFHEWIAGAGLLYLKKNGVKIGKVFTTHATVLGRAKADKGEIFREGNPEEEAYKLNIIDKHLLEKSTALNAEVFTTVSETTAEECEKVLGKKPEVVINGLDLKLMPDLEEVPEMHRKNKEKIKDLVMANFFPHYYFDIENCLFYYISGRYETRAKGIDVYIKALGKLNRRLKKEESKKVVVAFVLIPSDVSGVNQELLNNLLLLKNIKENINDYSEDAKKAILFSLFSNKGNNFNIKEFFYESKKLVEVLSKNGNPKIITHYLKQKEDRIVKMIHEEGLENSKDDKVKIIFYPAYLGENDGLMGLDYYHFVSGFHLGVFPSFYEPWGYTPFESAALGVSTITTDLSGFGRYVIEKNRGNEGIRIIKREGKEDYEIVEVLEDEMYNYLNLDKIQRIKNKTIAQEFAHQISWDNIIEKYLKAYKLSYDIISGEVGYENSN